MSSSTTPKQLETVRQSTSSDQSQNASGSSSSTSRESLKTFIQQLKNLPPDFLLLPRRADESPNHSDPSVNSSFNHAVNSGTMPTGTRTAGPIMGSSSSHSGQVSMLDLTIVEANLLKNYGFLRMDCYCKIRVGHSVCETQTCTNGAKNPRWDGVFHFHLQPGIDSFHLEIYDEKQFSTDEKIAWLHAPIPKQVFEGVIVERWYPLSGRLGEGKEGSILLVMSHKKVSHKQATNQLRGMHTQLMYDPSIANNGPIIRHPTESQVPIYITDSLVDGQQVISSNPDHNQQPSPNSTPAQQQPISAEDVTQLAEMFPNVDKPVIKAILENNYGDKNLAISALLGLNSSEA